MTITLAGRAHAPPCGNAEDPAVPNGGVPEEKAEDQAAAGPLEPELPLDALDFEPEEPEPDEDDDEPFDDEAEAEADVDADLESDEDEPEDDLSLEPPESPELFDAPALAGVLLVDEPRLSFR